MSVHVGGRGPGHMARVGGGSVNYGPAIDATMVIFVGQSNSRGWSSDPANATAVTKGYAFEFTYPSEIGPLGLTMQGRSQGGPQRPWAQAWAAGGGGPVLIVNTGVDGSSMQSAAVGGGGTWDLTSGTNNYTKAGGAQNIIDAALLTAATAGFNIVKKVVQFLQGETDAELNNGTTISATNYTAKHDLLIARFLADYAIDGYFISELGAHNDGTQEADFALYRAAQAQSVTNNAIAHMVFTGAKDFPGASKMVDNQHYTQAGYNDVGGTGAAAALTAIGGLSYPTPGATALAKHYALAALAPARTGYKKLVMTLNRSGTWGQSLFGSPATPSRAMWKDLSGNNPESGQQTIAWSFPDSTTKTVVLYCPTSMTAGTFVIGTDGSLQTMAFDAGVGVSTFNINSSGNSALTIAAAEFAKLTMTNLQLFLAGTGVAITDAILATMTTLQKLTASNTDASGITTFSANPSLDRLDLQPATPHITTAQVNSILSSIAAGAVSSGTLNLIQTTAPTAPPSGAGATAKTTLQGRSWTVNTD